MISVIVLFHNAPVFADECLDALLWAFEELRASTPVEFILVDDCSDPAHEIPRRLRDFRGRARAQVSITRFWQHRHYAYGLSYAMSRARGRQVLFLSHDMILPPTCVRSMLAVAGLSPSLGILRPVSRHMDMSDTFEIHPPLPPRTRRDVEDFAGLVARRRGLEVEPNRILIGDAMLVQREVIDRIGVADARFFGFMCDVDYGLRAFRAGFKVVTASGAWLHHVGAGAQISGTEAEARAASERNLADTVAALKIFKEKWQCTHIAGQLSAEDWDQLATANLDVDLFVPPLPIDPAICEVL